MINKETTSVRPDALNVLFASLQSLKGVGTKVAPLLERLTGPYVKDLLWHKPYNIIDRSFTPNLCTAPGEVVITATVRVLKHIPPPNNRRSKAPYKIVCQNDTGMISLIFFKAYGDYLQKTLPEGEVRLISGKVEWNYDNLQMAHPDYILPVEQKSQLEKPEAVYPLSAGITQKLLKKTMAHALAIIPELPEWLSEPIIKQHNWASWDESIKKIHNPQSIHDIDCNTTSAQRLAYDELLANQLALQATRSRVKRESGAPTQGTGKLQALLKKNLGFTLTEGQRDVIADIMKDQQSPLKMSRLLQGDVGSGKTVVALFSMLYTVEAGKQAALMVPTEILANQHFKWIQKVTASLNINVALLTGSSKTKERREIAAGLEDGTIHLLIGTHALFQDDVTFNNLGLAIIDEQHRFGVKQRLALAQKGKHVDMLLMTATPIPRTLTMTLYGDMDTSRLTDKPKGRKPITTRVIPLSRESEIIERLKKTVKEGNKAYWICPLIEESEESDLAAAEARFNLFNKLLPNQVGLAHGRMKSEERKGIMQAFKSGDICLLVATTVVEVGVDVPDATIMVIEHAERFGLSQLHQLRGRVGRGDKASSCVLLFDAPKTGTTGRARLNVLRDSEDGFFIAESDLKLRGTGDILGTKQSGLPTFHFADLSKHENLLQLAQKDAAHILNKDPSLTTDRGKNLRQLLYLFNYDKHIKYLTIG